MTRVQDELPRVVISLKAKNEGESYDYSCVEVFGVSEKLAGTFTNIEYETVRQGITA